VSEELLTIYGRMPVLEALQGGDVTVSAVFVARNARGDSLDEILDRAAARGIKVQRVSPERVSRISGNGRHDQGVVAEVVAPGLGELDAWLTFAPPSFRLFVLDGVTNPSNVGMIIRTSVAAGFDGVVVPRAGVAELGPLVIKASAGVALSATTLRADTAAAAVGTLRSAGVSVIGLAGDADVTIYDIDLADRVAFVLGNETAGVAVDVD
jgi:23S rRNA (guanosine2251-2'-O)-methyltransferase